MATLGKRKIRISPKDLKQAVLKKNKSLESKNKVLESSLKDKEKELKSLEQEYSSESKKLGKLISDIEFQEERMQKLKGGVYSNEKLLSEKLKKVGEAESLAFDYEASVEKLEERERNLLDKISKLEFYKSKCSDSKNELAGIQARKDKALDELDKVEDDISKTVDEAAEKISYYEDQYDALEEKAKKHEDMVYQFEQRLFETKDKALEEENNLQDILAKSKVEKENAGRELQAVNNLINESEDKYVNWEIKTKKISEKADKEEERIVNAKERFEKWKIGVLEEVARLKLKSKVDKIDKAGLSEILNG